MSAPVQPPIMAGMPSPDYANPVMPKAGGRQGRTDAVNVMPPPELNALPPSEEGLAQDAKPLATAVDGKLKHGTGKPAAKARKALPKEGSFQPFLEFGRKRVDAVLSSSGGRFPATGEPPPVAVQQPFRDYGRKQGERAEGEFFKGRYNRSRARLPENIDKWRAEPDIDNPGPDLANFPNSAFTLPQGRAYIEVSPFTFYGNAVGSPAQYNAEFLLRYGATDNIELRLFGNGLSWTGQHDAWGFSPIAFDTKIQLWTEKPEYFLPAAGFETYLQTEWLGNKPFNSGFQPSFMFNFDQSLPWDIDFEYNLGTVRFQDPAGNNDWDFSFQWALQRDLFDKDFAVFIHGYYNATSLPRLPNVNLPYAVYKSPVQNAVGGGFVWTVNKRLAIYGQVSGGTTKFTPSVNSLLGFAVSF